MIWWKKCLASSGANTNSNYEWAWSAVLGVAALEQWAPTHAMRAVVSVLTTLACDEKACKQLEDAKVMTLVQNVLIANSTDLPSSSSSSAAAASASEGKLKVNTQGLRRRVSAYGGGWKDPFTPADGVLACLCLQFLARSRPFRPASPGPPAAVMIPGPAGR